MARRRRVGYAGKLGDASTKSGSWAEYDAVASGMPAKFIVSSEAPREELWQRMLATVARATKRTTS